MADRPSQTHDHIVIKQDNGELQEDVVHRAEVEGANVDEQSDDSFPASDPPSHWSGPGTRAEDARRTRDRVVRRRPAKEVPERRHPAEP